MEEAAPSFWQFSAETVIPRLLEGMGLTLELTLGAGLCGILLGLVIALCRISSFKFLSWPAAVYVTVFRGTPLLLQILFVYFALPPLLDIRLDAMPAGILALSMNAAAYITEIFRAGIQSIDKGQMEAARAVGMSYGLAMRRIILPQTFRRLIPPMVNELAALAKDTSLVSTIALSEMLYITQRLGAKFLRPWEVYFWAAVGYLLIVLALSFTAGRLEKKLAAREA
jgi:His/Glu/Gln/Arg/opine family amino acid ABC transporter permease subunit